MMKKLLVFFCILAILAFTFFYVKSNFIPFCAFFFEKLTGLNVRPSTLHLHFRPWILKMDLGKVQVSGFMNGYSESVSIAIDFEKGYWFQFIRLSDFNISVGLPRTKKLPFSLPSMEYLEAKNGKISFGGKEITVYDLRLKNLVPGKTFGLTGHVGCEPLFSTGIFNFEGTYRETLEHLKGSYEIKRLRIVRIIPPTEGEIDLTGTLTLKGSKLNSQGRLEIPGVSIKGKIFKEPYVLAGAKGFFSLTYLAKSLNLKTSLENSDGIAMNLSIRMKNGTLETLKLGTGEMEMEKIKRYLDVKALTGFDPWKYMMGGKIKITDLSYREGFPLTTKILLNSTSISFAGLPFEDVNGEIFLHGEKLDFSRVSGRYRLSRIEDVNGGANLAQRINVKMRGSFLAQLSDIWDFINLEKIKISTGLAKGVFTLSWDEEAGVKYRAEGEIERGEGLFYGTNVSFRGRVQMSEEGFYFSPLFLSHDKTELVVNGFLSKGYNFDLAVEGKLSANTLRSLTNVKWELEGVCPLKGRLRRLSEGLSLSGNMDLTDFSVFIPPFFKKERGVTGILGFDLEKHGNNIIVKDLLLALQGIHLKGSGQGNSYTMDCDFSLHVKNFEDVASYFYFDDLHEKGEIEAKIAVRDLSFSFDRLPSVRGYIKVKNGFFRLPNLRYPVKNLDLRADFEEETVNVRFYSAAFGNSTLKSADIKLKGLKSPVLSGSVHIERLYTSDFVREKKEKILFPVLKEKHLPWKTKVFLNIAADHVVHKDMRFDGVSASIVKEQGDFRLDNFTARLLGGGIEMRGSLMLSEPKPRSLWEIKIKEIDLRQMSSFLEKKYVFDGKANLVAKLKTEGADSEEMMKSLNGEIYAISRKGVIKKWNLLARIFELLNVYQIIKLKLNLSKEGIVYNRMGGSFSLADGKLTTKDFAIDSPSMIILAKGEIDTRTGEVKGTMSFSPLVAIERTVDKIPILRNILKPRNQGFLTVDYSVRGKLAEPEIHVDVVRTLPGKIFDILKNILTLPKDILELE